ADRRRRRPVAYPVHAREPHRRRAHDRPVARRPAGGRVRSHGGRQALRIGAGREGRHRVAARWPCGDQRRHDPAAVTCWRGLQPARPEISMTRRTLAAATIIAASLATTAAALQQKARPAALTPLPPKVADVAAPLPLTAVRLTGGPLKHAQDLDRARMLAFYRERAGLQKKAEPYGGWDGDKRNLTGHIAGHYLSAVSLMYAATGDPAFKQRADYIVDELKAVQDRQGDGYV